MTFAKIRWKHVIKMSFLKRLFTGYENEYILCAELPNGNLEIQSGYCDKRK